ncbi:hypothetical protein V8E53_012849, partial [Lactarius tabidus]
MSPTLAADRRRGRRLGLWLVPVLLVITTSITGAADSEIAQRYALGSQKTLQNSDPSLTAARELFTTSYCMRLTNQSLLLPFVTVSFGRETFCRDSDCSQDLALVMLLLERLSTHAG